MDAVSQSSSQPGPVRAVRLVAHELDSARLVVAGELDAAVVAELDFQVLVLLCCGDLEQLCIDASAVTCCDGDALAGLARIRSRLVARGGTVEITGLRLGPQTEVLAPTGLHTVLDDALDTALPRTPPLSSG